MVISKAMSWYALMGSVLNWRRLYSTVSSRSSWVDIGNVPFTLFFIAGTVSVLLYHRLAGPMRLLAYSQLTICSKSPIMVEVMHYACLAVKVLLGVDEVMLRPRLLSRASPEWKEAYYAIMNLLNSSHAMIPYFLSYMPAHDNSVQDPFG